MDSYGAKENTKTTKSIRFHPWSLSWYLIDSIWLGNTIHEFQGKGAQIQEYSGRVFVSSFQELHVGENYIPLRVFVTEILSLIISSFTIYVKHWTWILKKLSYLSQKFLQLWIQEYHLHVLVKRYELKINSCFSSNFHHQLAFCSDQVYFLPPSTDLKVILQSSRGFTFASITMWFLPLRLF